MNNNTQVNEDYKFRITYIFNFFKDLFSESGAVEDKELNNKIEVIMQEQDNTYLEDLEKELEKHEVTKKRRKTENQNKKAKINDSIKENNRLRNNETIMDEEKEI